MRLHTICGLLLLMLTTVGCQGWFSKVSPNSQSPDDEPSESASSSTMLLDNVAFPYGRDRIDVEGVGLVVGLPGTGGDPDESVYRTQLLDEMLKREVDKPSELLASPNTALVLVRGVIRPGMEKGDTFDLEVKAPDGSGVTNLRGGYLMQMRLTEVAFAGGALRRGDLLGLAEGYVLVDPNAEKADAKRGRVLGGGICLKPHSVGMVLRPDYQTIAYSAQLGESVNRRFQVYRSGIKEKVATPKTNEFIELDIHPRYKHNVARYLRVIGSLPLRETSAGRMERLQELKHDLETPSKSGRAALQLEAIGNDAIPVLLEGLHSPYAEVRFYSAEALAYIDDTKSRRDVATALASAAREEPAFRVYAFTALSTMNDMDSYAELSNLLHAPSAETRYGAFRSLWAMNANDPLVRADENMKDKFSYHVLNTSGPPMIHITSSFRPEVVLFGANLRFMTPFVLDAGAEIMIRGQNDGSVLISKISMREPDQKRMVSGSVDEVIRAVAELGGQYHDIVQMLEQAHAKGVLADNCRLEIDALPQSGRRFVPEDGRPPEAEAEVEESRFGLGMPSLFAGMNKAKSEERSTDPEFVSQPKPKPGFLKRMFSW